MIVEQELWLQVRNSMVKGHLLPRAILGDQFLYQADNILLSRSAWVPGLGIGVKSCSVYPDNPSTYDLPTIHGSMVIFDDANGKVRGTLDNDEVTNLKTAADSVLGSSLLARAGSTKLLILGAGKVALHLVQAYAALMPHLTEVSLWNRTTHRGAAAVSALTKSGFRVKQVSDLRSAVQDADVISSALMTSEPVLKGTWVQPGTHVDLIGAFNKKMREADDVLVTKARLFCDCFDTTVDHIGEFYDPLARGVIKREDVLGDLYGLVPGEIKRESSSEITLFKNGGGAHLDLMTAQVLLP